MSHTDDLIVAKRVTDPTAIIERIVPGTELIVPIANGEPVVLLDTIEAHAERLDGVTVHQMHALRDRPTMHGAFGDHLHHISYFLSGITRARHIANLRADGVEVIEAVLTFDDFHAADEVFLSGNFAKVTPVRAFEDTQYQVGPLTLWARQLYWDWAHSAA